MLHAVCSAATPALALTEQQYGGHACSRPYSDCATDKANCCVLRHAGFWSKSILSSYAHGSNRCKMRKNVTAYLTTVRSRISIKTQTKVVSVFNLYRHNWTWNLSTAHVLFSKTYYLYSPVDFVKFIGHPQTQISTSLTHFVNADRKTVFRIQSVGA